jgi:hypothetical protein
MARVRWLISVGLLALIVLVVALTVSPAEDTSQPNVTVAGPEEVVFDWSEEACRPRDIPDAPARAFRDFTGRVQLISSHHNTRTSVGPSLNRIRHSCRVVMSSRYDPDPAAFADREWIASPYTRDGKNVVALVHDEYHGHRHPGRCRRRRYEPCWYNAVTLALSHNAGKTYTRPRDNVVSSIPYRYPGRSGPIGVFSPSNIVYKKDDGHYYVLVQVQAYKAQSVGTCLLRTATVAEPGSWRAWSGDGFDVRFADPYRDTRSNPRDHVCEPVSYSQIEKMAESVTFNTKLEKFLLVGASGKRDRNGRVVWGIYFSLSDDLIHWSRRQLVKRTELPSTYKCGDRSPIAYPSVLDPDSPSRNFETTDERAYLYYTRFNYINCIQTLNRDLLRVPIEVHK